MRYTLTYTTDGDWVTTNTITVEAPSEEDIEDNLYDILDSATGYSREYIGDIIGDGHYYITDCNEPDYTIEEE